MIGIDTNVLVRYLTADEPTQLKKARRLLSTLSAQNPGFICRETILELVWVLDYSYDLKRDEIADALEALVLTIELEVEDVELLGGAIDVYRHGGADFADLMIRAAAEKRGALPLMTFDTKAARLEGVELLT